MAGCRWLSASRKRTPCSAPTLWTVAMGKAILSALAVARTSWREQFIGPAPAPISEPTPVEGSAVAHGTPARRHQAPQQQRVEPDRDIEHGEEPQGQRPEHEVMHPTGDEGRARRGLAGALLQRALPQ